MQRGFFNITEIRAQFKNAHSVTIQVTMEAKTLDEVQEIIRQQLRFYKERWNVPDDEMAVIADIKYVY